MSLRIFPPCPVLKPYVLAIVDYQDLFDSNTAIIGMVCEKLLPALNINTCHAPPITGIMRSAIPYD